MAEKKAAAGTGDEVKVLVRNKRARHDYHVERTIEAGLQLRGSEVKSLRDARATISDAYAAEKNGELWLLQLQINEYPWATQFQHEPKRERKLLLHRREIEELASRTQQDPLTLVPLSIYFKDNRAKVELALARGRKRYDKRHAIAERDAARETARAMAARRRGGE